jgi:type II secretory pathway component PulF
MTISSEIIFQPLLGQIFASDFWHSSLAVLFRLLLALFFGLVWLGGIFGSIFLIHFLFTLPMRRAERARLFLDLLADALKRGQSIEEMILSIAHNHDRTVGVHFHLLAAHIEGGLRFGEALDRVPGLLPPQIAAMLRAGEKLGDLQKVLPACREILRDRPAGVRSAMHYLILVVLFFSPVFVFVVMMTVVFVIPRFKEVAAGMAVRLWPETTFVFAHTGWLIGLETILSLLMFGVVLLYIGGPQFVRWFQFRQAPLADWMAWRVPWKQKRLQRTFSAMLAVLLDGGVPEAEAVRLAGDCTANEICRRRSQRVIGAIQQGTQLDAAVRAFDDSGEFHWRLTNATHARGGFLDALRGWHEALDAKAFQQEEATAHAVTTGVVILNGLLVALIATAMFGIILAVLNGMLASG